MASGPEVGDQAPDFTLPGAGGATVRLADYVGKKTVVLYFYPKDDTTGCTIESCSFRDMYQDFSDAGAEVIGVSVDSVESHDKFKAKHRLPFVLASDTTGETRKKYGAEGLFGIIPGRVTYVIDRKGKVRYKFSSMVKFKEHVERSLELVRALEPGSAHASAAGGASSG